jgi:hypothetical protein
VNSLCGYCSLNSDYTVLFSIDGFLRRVNSDKSLFTLRRTMNDHCFFFLIIRNINFIIIFLNYCSVNSDILLFTKQ